MAEQTDAQTHRLEALEAIVREECDELAWRITEVETHPEWTREAHPALMRARRARLEAVLADGAEEQAEIERVKAQRDYYFDLLGTVLNNEAHNYRPRRWSEEARTCFLDWLNVVHRLDSLPEGEERTMRQLARVYLDEAGREVPADE